MTSIKAVLFDYGGTLDSDGVHWRDRFYSLYVREGLEAPRDRFAPAFYDADDNLPTRFSLAGLSLEETVRLQVGCVLENLAEGGAWDRALGDRVVRGFLSSSRERFQRNRPVLERLGRRFRLGIVSNFYGNMDSILASEGLAELFGAVADSERVGALKPDKEIFLHATRGLEVEPGEALMVGDSVRRDMRGAEALGMPHAWLAGPQDPAGVCCDRARLLRALPEVEGLLMEAVR